MLFLEAFLIGFGVTLGVEIALGLCIAIRHVTREVKK